MSGKYYSLANFVRTGNQAEKTERQQNELKPGKNLKGSLCLIRHQKIHSLVKFSLSCGFTGV